MVIISTDMFCVFTGLGEQLKVHMKQTFDNKFIVLLESALKDKINAVYHLLITCLDPNL